MVQDDWWFVGFQASAEADIDCKPTRLRLELVQRWLHLGFWYSFIKSGKFDKHCSTLHNQT